MGNQCPECPAPTEGCKPRDLLKSQLSNRDELNIQHIKKGEYKKREERGDKSVMRTNKKVMEQSQLMQSTVKQLHFERGKENESKVSMIDNFVSKPLTLEITLPAQTLCLKKGVKYMGSVANGQPHQKGKVLWQDGTTLTANFFLGQIGKREVIKIDFGTGDKYEGQVDDGTANGKGKMQLNDGSFYEGQWQNDSPHGEGKHSMANGCFYEGRFERGKKKGKGKFYFNEGMFQGYFQDNKFEGEGIMVLNDGKIYKGTWRDGLLDGQGQVQYNGGASYIGSFVNGLREGEGKYQYGDGRVWIGEWKGGKQNGFGKYEDGSGNIIKGIWVEGRKKDQLKETFLDHL